MGDDPMPDDLMSKFEAIERMLTARRQEEYVPEEPAQDVRQAPGKHALRQRRQVIIGVLIVIVLAAGGTAVALGASNGGGANGADPQPSASPSSSTTAVTPAEQAAAKWVATAVGPSREVACDEDMCALLRQDGISATSVISSDVDVSAIAGADVVVTTNAMREALGPSLAAITSAEPLASFGSGADRVEVTTVAPSGTVDYAQRLTQDRAARKRVGAQLVHNPRIILSSPELAARLADGQVDTRLCSLLALLGASHTVTIASFTPPGPGAGPDIPAATMVLYAVDGRSATGSSPEARTLLALLAAQKPPYRPTAAVAETAGLRIGFAQPEPLGLISGAKP